MPCIWFIECDLYDNRRRQSPVASRADQAPKAGANCLLAHSNGNNNNNNNKRENNNNNKHILCINK